MTLPYVMNVCIGENAAEVVFITFRPTDESKAYMSTCQSFRTECETTPRLVVCRIVRVPSCIAMRL